MLPLNFTPFPELATTRLRLAQMLLSDAPALFTMRSDKEVMKYIDRPLAKTVADAEALIKVVTALLDKNDGITWGIFLKEENTLMGTIGFWRIQKEHYRAEIGYLLHPSLQGKGIMQEAMTAVLKYGFDSMHLHSVEAVVNPSNNPSIKLLQKNGFIREAYFRENYFSNGRFLDSAIYSLLSPTNNNEMALPVQINQVS